MSVKRTIYANFDTSKLSSLEKKHYNVQEKDGFGLLNFNPSSITLRLIEQSEPSKLVFSTNGIVGVGDENNTFRLNSIYYSQQKIYFCVTCRTENDFYIKRYPKLSLDNSTYNIKLSCIDEDGNNISTTFTPFFYDGKEYNAGGYFKGYTQLETSEKRVKIYAEHKTLTKTITGESTWFTVHPLSGKYHFRKINEDHDQSDTYRDLRYQTNLLDKNVFFGTGNNDGFLETVVGNNRSDPDESLGIKTYEKISNFVMNNSDINYSNINSFLSQLDNLDIGYEKYKTNFPPSLQRVLDVVSLNLSLLKGEQNSYQFNFDNKGFLYNDDFGKNLGEEIDFKTYQLKNTPLTGSFISSPIIAYEKFGEKYLFLNTNLVSAYDMRYADRVTQTYNLSDYDSSWGWGLVLPDEIVERQFFMFEDNTIDINGDSLKGAFLRFEQDNGLGFYRPLNEEFVPEIGSKEKIQAYYTFYKFNDSVEGTYYQKYIDYDNTLTTFPKISSFNDYAFDGGVVDDLILNKLYTNARIK